MANLIPQLIMCASALQATARAGMLPRWAAAPLALDSGPWRTPIAAVLATAALSALLLPLGYDALVQLHILYGEPGATVCGIPPAARHRAQRGAALCRAWWLAWRVDARSVLIRPLLHAARARSRGHHWVGRDNAPRGDAAFPPSRERRRCVVGAHRRTSTRFVAKLSETADTAGGAGDAAPPGETAALLGKWSPGLVRGRESQGLVPAPVSDM